MVVVVVVMVVVMAVSEPSAQQLYSQISVLVQ